MKSTIISMLIVLVVMVALPMIFLGDGELLKQFGLFKGEPRQEAPVALPENVKPVVTDKRVEVYTWVDENGIKQYSNKPPAEGGKAEKLVLEPDSNVIDGLKLPEQQAEEKVSEESEKATKLSNPYTPGGMKDLLENSKELQEGVNERMAEQQKMMEQIFKKQK